MAQQTAVDWYYEQTVIQGRTNYAELLEQAKQMEKEQIMKAYHDDNFPCSHYGAEQYYNEIYGKQ